MSRLMTSIMQCSNRSSVYCAALLWGGKRSGIVCGWTSRHRASSLANISKKTKKRMETVNGKLNCVVFCLKVWLLKVIWKLNRTHFFGQNIIKALNVTKTHPFINRAHAGTPRSTQKEQIRHNDDQMFILLSQLSLVDSCKKKKKSIWEMSWADRISSHLSTPNWRNGVSFYANHKNGSQPFTAHKRKKQIMIKVRK